MIRCAMVRHSLHYFDEVAITIRYPTVSGRVIMDNEVQIGEMFIKNTVQQKAHISQTLLIFTIFKTNSN